MNTNYLLTLRAGQVSTSGTAYTRAQGLPRYTLFDQEMLNIYMYRFSDKEARALYLKGIINKEETNVS